MKRFFKITSTVLVLIFLITMTACSSKKPSTTINILGSTSVQPIAEQMAEEYNLKGLGVQVLVQGVGSSQGITAVNSGTTEIGSTSRDLKDDEKKFNLKEHIIAYDCIAVIVSPNNPLKNLTKDQLTKIYNGEIVNWKDLGGEDKKIDVVNREEGSGTRTAFQENLGLTELISDSISFDSTGAVKTTVAGNDSAIGYISLGVLDDTVLAVSIDGVVPTAENVKNKSYSIWRPFILLTKGTVTPEVQAFIDYTTSAEAQAIVEEDHYLPVK